MAASLEVCGDVSGGDKLKRTGYFRTRTARQLRRKDLRKATAHRNAGSELEETNPLEVACQYGGARSAQPPLVRSWQPSRGDSTHWPARNANRFRTNGFQF